MARDPSKTEEATPKRRNKARSEGNVPKSQEISKTMSILGGLIGLTICIGYISGELIELFRHFLSQSYTYTVSQSTMGELGMQVAFSLAKMLLPFMLIIFFIVAVSLRVQVGKLWTTKIFAPKWNRFNPISGFKRMFISVQTFMRLGKSLLLALTFGIAPLLVLKNEMPRFPELYYMDAAGVAVYMLSISSKMVLYALVPMVAIAVADLWYTRWDYNENIKMTKDEVKDERKQMEGDEKIKLKMKQKMLEMSARRMMQQVPKADVVITNPNHIAVALRYDVKEAPAPVVVAMGVDRVAERIKEIAREHKVPVKENKPLARALYKQTEIGDMIPEELFQAVAIILAQIWKTKHPGRTVKP